MSHSARPEPEEPAIHPALARRVGRSRTRTTSWGGTLGPAPAAADRAAGERPGPDPEEPVEVTEPITGLGESDLGLVPVAASPPRPSHRRAWFAVAGTGAVLGGLLLATATLVSPSEPIEGTDLTALPPDPVPPAPQARRVEPPSGLAALPDPAVLAQPAEVPVPLPRSAPPPAETAAAPAGPAPAEPPPTTERAPLPEPTFRTELVRFADPELVAGRSGAYFAAIRDGDLRSAYEMSTGDLRAGGYAAFAEPYAGARRIEVRAVRAASTETVTDLRITRADGTVLDQRRRLRFTAGSDPRMYADDPAG